MKQRFERLLEGHEELADLDPPARRLQIGNLLGRGSNAPSCTAAAVADHIDAVGRLTGLLADDSVTDVLVNGAREVWIERGGCLELTDVVFEDDDELYGLIERVLSRSGARADASHPIADARLPDGSRVHVVLPPLSQNGPLVSIRRHRRRPPTIQDLVAMGAMDVPTADRLRGLVRSRSCLVIGGATGSGKTTLLSALLGEIGARERVVIVEETAELQPTCEHAVSLLARSPNVEGRGAVGLTELLHAALRMRPDRIVVGEVRGPEAWPALNAMSTGHRGSMLTVHCGSAAGAVARLARLARGSSSCDSQDAAGALARDAIDAIVHMERDGAVRRVVEILEPGR